MATTAEIFQQYGIPSDIWQPIMQVESGGNPQARALTAKEDSVGLFQLNRKGGLGTGYSVEQLQDPVFNATIAAKKMSPIYKKGVEAGLSGYDLTQYVAYNGGWPTQAGVSALSFDKVVQSYDAKLRGAYDFKQEQTLSLGDYTAAVSGGTPAPGLVGQLSSLQQRAEGTGLNAPGAIGLMVILATLGIVLVFLGLKFVAGNQTIAVTAPGEGDS